MKGYKFREAGKGTWVITSDIKILRRVSEEERQKKNIKNNSRRGKTEDYEK